MGSPDKDTRFFGDELPAHEVHIGYSFAVSEYPVSRGQWRAFLTAKGHSGSGPCDGLSQSTGIFEETAAYSWRDPGFPQDDSHPVVCVSWNDAQEYVAWLSQKSGHRYRLLSEAEYEYLNRAGTRTVYFWGNTTADLCRYANGADSSLKSRYPNTEDAVNCRDGYAFTSPVGSYKPNDFGLYDTTGNVWSWTQDCWHKSYTGAPADGRAWETGDCNFRVVRGGSWLNGGYVLRASVRDDAEASDRECTIGLRVARSD